jgi:diamine N-acetyltransferase
MLVGDGIRLRAIERDDIPRFVRWLNDREVTQFLLTGSPFSKSMEEKWFENQLAKPPEQGQILGIEILQGEEWIHIGNCGLHFVEPVNNAAEFGIMIGEKSFWNRGYGKKATTLMLQHGFDDLNLNRIYLNVFETNPRGIRAYQACGFQKEGVLREAIYKEGRYLDVFVMSILHSEWKSLRKQGDK